MGLKDKCDVFDKINEAGKWRMIHEQHGPNYITALKNLLEYIAYKMYALQEKESMDDSTNITTLWSYMLIVVQVVKHLPPRLAGQLTKKDLVDKFLDFISPYISGNVKNVLKDYIKTYCAAFIKDQKLNSKDGWNLLFTITVMKSFLTDLKETVEGSCMNWQTVRHGQEALNPQKVREKGQLHVNAPSPSSKTSWFPTTARFNSVQAKDYGEDKGYQDGYYEDRSYGDGNYGGSQDVMNTPLIKELEKTTTFNTITNSSRDHFTKPYFTVANNAWT